MESQRITSPKASRTISLPKHEAKGMGIVDNRQEAIVQSKMIGNIKRQAFREIPNMNKAIRSDTPVQCKGEAEALANITTDERETDGDRREMSRGNANEDVKDTHGVSYAWITYLRSQKFKTSLKDQVHRLYLSSRLPADKFKVWYASRQIMIEGLVYKHIGSGNCGEFASALYGELQQNTSNQYIYRASWMWETSANTPAINGYRKANPGVFIKSQNADHAFVVTYPELLPSEDFRYTSEVKIENPPSEGIPIYCVARHKIAGIQYRDQAMVADGWLDRKVKTINQAKYTDKDTLLSNPQKAGENTLAPNIHKEIAKWAEEFKQEKENDVSFKLKAQSVKDGSPKFYANDPNWEAAPKDIRPVYVEVFHGVPAEQVQNLIVAWDRERELLIEFTKHTKSELIEELGKQVVADGNRKCIFVFLQLLNVSGVSDLCDQFIQWQLTALTTLVAQLEVHVGRETLVDIFDEVKEFYNLIPQDNRLQFKDLVHKANDILKRHSQLMCFKKLLSQLEGQIGVLAFEKTFDIMREQYNLIPQDNRLQFKDLVHRANDILKRHRQYLELNSLVKEMNGLVGKPGFMDAFGKYESLYDQILDRNDNFYKIVDRAILVITKHSSPPIPVPSASS